MVEVRANTGHPAVDAARTGSHRVTQSILARARKREARAAAHARLDAAQSDGQEQSAYERESIRDSTPQLQEVHDSQKTAQYRT